jgi:uncharacterized protein involved in exopolysaccharide biosynthesis
MATQSTSLGDFLLTISKRRALALGIGVPILLVSIYLAVALPPIYRATARILIENQDIPTDFVRAVVTGFGEERVQLVRGRVMTRSTLKNVVEKFDLYPEIQRADSVDAASGELARNVLFEMEEPEDGTLAFTLSYEHPVAETSSAVARELVELYLSENIQSRTELTEATLGFLAEEADRLQSEIADIESRLAEFKEANTGALPDLVQMNTQLLERTERDLETVETRIRELREERSLLNSQLSQLSPYITVYDQSGNPVVGSAERLQLLQQDFLRLSAIYSPDHPDIIKIRREIDVLTGGRSSSAARSNLQQALADRQAELQVMRDRYSADHPDVVRLERTVGNLQRALEAATAEAAANTGPTREPNNPAYIQTSARSQRVNQELNALSGRRQELRGKLTDYEDRLGRTPEVERVYLGLNRDYERLQEKYYENRQRQEDARLALRLEREQKGDRFRLIDPPRTPSEPAKPNRPAILVLGFMLALALGMGLAVAAENMDGSVRGSRDVREILDTPPIAFIPVVNTAADLRQIWIKRSAAAASVLVAAVVIVWTAIAG